MSPEEMIQIEDDAERHEVALKLIGALGSVCEDFEVCDHASCRDSSAAFLIARGALAQRTPDPERGPNPQSPTRLEVAARPGKGQAAVPTNSVRSAA